MSKKTVETIIESGNDDLIQVKGNQQTLWRTITDLVQQQVALSTASSEERAHGRHERRTVRLLGAPPPLCDAWSGLRRVISVERMVTRNGKESTTQSYDMSSISSDEATVFADGIRGHWSIENRLHWVKDVIQHEDESGIRKGNGVETLSILKNIAINMCRELGFASIKAATIHFASNVKELCTDFRT